MTMRSFLEMFRGRMRRLFPEGVSGFDGCGGTDRQAPKKNSDPRLAAIPALPVDHLTARALTGWSASVLDARLGRSHWSRARRCSPAVDGGDRAPVVFEPLLFAKWLRTLVN